jgi:hypothetical protein
MVLRKHYYYFTILFTTTLEYFLYYLLHLTLAAEGSEVVFCLVFQG